MAGSASGPLTLDPALVRDAESAFIARQIFRGLVRLDDDLQPQPDLADRIEISADGTRYTFHIRSNAVFHDGSPIDAQSVADAFNRATDPALTTTDQPLPAATYLSDVVGVDDRLAGRTATISGIAVVDRATLELRLAHPSADFLYKLAGPPTEVVDVRTARGADWWRRPNGSGPFTLEPYTPGGAMVLRAFDAFYGGAPALREVRILGGSDAAQPLNLYEAGKIDVTGVPFYSIDRVLSPSDPLHSQLVVEPQLSTAFLVMNPNVAPFDNRDLRLAIAHAFDRAKEVRVGFEGRVDLADGLIPPGIGGRNWPANVPNYDLDLARQLLAEAGTPTTPPTVYEPGGALVATLDEVLQRDLGLDIDAIDLDWADFQRLLTERTLPAYVLSWIADYPDPENFLGVMFHSGSSDNYIGYSNPQFDELLDRAERDMDPAQRGALFLQAQQLLIDDGVLLPLYHDVSYTLIAPSVHGLAITPVGILSLDTVWIEK